ncbi:unnamed protein product [Ilex paraguariensis]|uniref:Isopropylmalate dehydrogenase-like domain-containing protein n=1 Tax=Ilex paraguariensis TaxID=185542 RepID=A0ABC8TJW9_9AQUA
MAALQINLRPFTPQVQHLRAKSIIDHVSRPAKIRCSATPPTKSYNITLLPGDGIGPEVISVAKHALKLAGSLEGTSNPYLKIPPLFSVLVVERDEKEKKIFSEKQFEWCTVYLILFLRS